MNNTAWFGSLYTSFEAAFYEVDDFMSQSQEDIEYAKNQMQIMGANIKQFCSDLVQEVFSYSSIDDRVEGGASDDSSLAHIADKADKILKEKKGIGKCHIENEPCIVSQLLHSCSGEPIQVEDCKLHSGVTSSSIKENYSEEKQVPLQASDGASPDKKDPSLLVAPRTFNDLKKNSIGKISSLGVSSSNSVNLVHSCESDILDVSKLGSARKMRLNESCIIVDSSTELSSDSRGIMDSSELCCDSHVEDGRELSSDSHEAGWDGSCKEKFSKAIDVGRSASRQGNDEQGDWYQNPDSEPCQQEGKDSESFAVTTLDECSDSDWEII